MKSNNPFDYVAESGPMGAIGESGSLMLRVNRNCPWNRCLFCPVYKNKQFSNRTVGELKQDIDAVSRTRDLIMKMSGNRFEITAELLYEIVSRNPRIYGASGIQPSLEQQLARGCLTGTANWIYHGAKRVFLQDADALAIKITDLIEIIKYLKISFPTIDTITCYARSRSCAHRSIEELAALRDAGLTWCFIGVESGCDVVLDYMKKGATGKNHIEAGTKLRQAGVNVAAFVMPGLAGYEKSLSEKHVTDTIFVLNEMKPEEIRVRSLAVLQRSPLYQKWKSGEFVAPTEDSLAVEMRKLLEGIEVECTIETLQMTNPVICFKGPINAKREFALKKLDDYLALNANERARFNLRRYCEEGYLRFVEEWGGLDTELERMINEAYSSIETGESCVPEKVERVLSTIKSIGIP